ncbi:hypothetical protein [Glaciibacter flavus]|uniref:hypothetical protein n=1 Tax=Orlajensenia flava TaxID=2565934 RepID=UPI003B00DDAF
MPPDIPLATTRRRSYGGRMDARKQGLAWLEVIGPDLLALRDAGIGRMFGSDSYSVRGKLFAFVSSDGALVVKLPAERIEQLGLSNMVMRGSVMREWATVPLDDTARWRAVAVEAHAFVDSITP